ncbi:hypothetical protein HanXRQr2_Chr08g0354341 [Helianthus annuus]|uniref:Uncharacterized protein n=1 Tax=Helianthus annuus TaxID=4232 RepID=A0A251USV2_HELAN|nr:hypothetical protein HanXRQr2_Chr08g0354341 [Helianthus annuus]KAJ0548309.1 hypothetical protein HanIR_Chr08g0382271 [Helianthus annuus]KAJ0902857.1 hypothetical protein HanPSC8_Chr08g0342161 [Helianthus annuus]
MGYQDYESSECYINETSCSTPSHLEPTSPFVGVRRLRRNHVRRSRRRTFHHTQL